MSKQEKIVCAATEFKYDFIADAVIPRINYNDNYTNDHQYIMSLHDEDVVCIKKTDGFITNKNRFVDPKDAAHIALDNDQVDEVNKLWDVFAKQKNEKDRNRMQEIIYEKTSLMLQNGLKPEDLY